MSDKPTLASITQMLDRAMESLDSVEIQTEGDIRKVVSKSIDDINAVLTSYFTKGPAEQSKFRLRSQLTIDYENNLDLIVKKQVKRCLLALQTFLRFVTHFDVLCMSSFTKVSCPSTPSSQTP